MCPLRVSGGVSAPQARASGLRSTPAGHSIRIRQTPGSGIRIRHSIRISQGRKRACGFSAEWAKAAGHPRVLRRECEVQGHVPPEEGRRRQARTRMRFIVPRPQLISLRSKHMQPTRALVFCDLPSSHRAHHMLRVRARALNRPSLLVSSLRRLFRYLPTRSVLCSE